MSQQVTLVCAPACPAGSPGSGGGGGVAIVGARRRDGAAAAGSAQAADLYARVRVLQLAAEAVGARGDAALLAGVAAAASSEGARALAPGRDLALALASGARPLDLLRAADPSAAGRVGDAAAIAQREKSRGRDAAVVCVFEPSDAGPAALDQFVEATSAALAGELPVVFVLECNLRGERGDVCDAASTVAAARGIPVDQVDGMAPDAVERAVAAALACAAHGGGPRVLEALTFYPPGKAPHIERDPAAMLRGARDVAHAERSAVDAAREALHLLALHASLDAPAPELCWDEPDDCAPASCAPDAPEITLLPTYTEVSLSDVA